MIYKEKSLEKIKLSEKGIIYRNIFYHFSKITHLKFQYVQTRVNFAKDGPETIILDIVLNDGNIIKLQVDERRVLWKIQFLGMRKNKLIEINNVKQFYAYLSEKTFQYRLQLYINQLEENNCFVYDKCTFIPPNTIIIKNKSLNVYDTLFSRYPGYLTLEKKNKSVLNKIGDKWSGPPFFWTEVDRDIIFYLLDKFFNLRFGN